SHEQGLFVLADLLYIFGISTNHLLIHLLILFSSIPIFPIYMLAKKHFNPTIAVIACIIFALSYTQLTTFSYMYYKNIIAITTMLLFFVFIDKNQFLAVIFATATGFYHRPTFLILAIVWLVNSIATKKIYLKSMIITAFLLMLIYLPRFNMIIVDTFSSLIKNISSPSAGGTFFSPTYFRIVSLSYLPFAFHYMIKQKKINLLFIWAFVSGIIIFAELFFFNRFLTNFDLAITILAAAGIYHSILPIKQNHLKLFIIIILILSSAWLAFIYASSLKPLLNENEIKSIKNVSASTKKDSYIIIPSSYYSPWILGYSDRKAIAPGIFEHNKWSFDQWQKYWSASSFDEIKPLLDVYEKPLYVFIAKQRNNIQNMEKFNNSCFTTAYEDDFHILLEYKC
ncbi:MAG: hypothetical protein KQA35_03945, partial [Candidatus Aenigmarchaeota archaeon]|nr:hypothetical protein [Candidatus Aenigmarchaeota archaeon]